MPVLSALYYLFGEVLFTQLSAWHPVARKLLNTIHPLVIGPNTYKSEFAKVVEGTLRRDYLTLLTTVYLAEHDEPEMQIAFGNSCMDLSRRVLEDFISLEYMLFKEIEYN